METVKRRELALRRVAAAQRIAVFLCAATMRENDKGAAAPMNGPQGVGAFATARNFVSGFDPSIGARQG